MYSVIIF